MKKIFIVIPSLLMLSGCITSIEAEREYRKQCKQLKEPYVNQELFNKFLNERNINIISDDLECSMNLPCSLLKKRDRWDNVKITNFNNKSIIYYKDFSLKNCIEVPFGPAIYTKDNKKFCIGSKKDDSSIKFKIRYESDSNYLYKKNSRYVSNKYDKVYYNNELMLEREAIIFHAPTAYDTCNSSDKIYHLLIDNL